MRRALWLAVLAAGLLAAAPAAASEERPTLHELEGEVVCPTCNTTLDLSDAPVADRIRALIRARIAAGDTKSEIKRTLVDEFGPAVLAAPPKRGFNLLAWLLPLAGVVAGAAVVGVLVLRWSKAREPGTTSEPDPASNGRARLDPELEKRLDEELAHFE